MGIDAAKAGQEAQDQTNEALTNKAVGAVTPVLIKNWHLITLAVRGNLAKPTNDEFEAMAKEAIATNTTGADGKNKTQITVKNKDGSTRIVNIADINGSEKILEELPKSEDLQKISSAVGGGVRTGIKGAMSTATNWGGEMFSWENIKAFFSALFVSIKNMLGMGDGKGEGLGDFFARFQNNVAEKGVKQVEGDVKTNLEKLRDDPNSSASLKNLLTAPDRIQGIVDQVGREARKKAGLPVTTDSPVDAKDTSLNEVTSDKLTPEQILMVRKTMYDKVQPEAYIGLRDFAENARQNASVKGLAIPRWAADLVGPTDEQLQAGANIVAEASSRFMTTHLPDGRMPADLNRANGEFGRVASSYIAAQLKEKGPFTKHFVGGGHGEAPKEIKVPVFDDDQITTIAQTTAMSLRQKYDKLPFISAEAMPEDKAFVDGRQAASPARAHIAGAGADNLGSGLAANANTAPGTSPQL